MRTEPDTPIFLDQDVPSGFVYENEHPQLQLPFTAHVGDRRMEGQSLSVMKAHVSGLLPPGFEQKRRPVILNFDFQGFSVTLYVEADIEKVGHADSADFELRFCDPTASHLAPLRYILNSHLAGDLVTVGRFMGFAGPTQVKPKAAQAKRGFFGRVRDVLRGMALTGLSLGLIAVAVIVVQQRLVFSYEPRPVLISQSGDTLRATAAGQVSYVNSDAAAGEVVYSIAANTGSLLSVRMPCDCDAQPLSDLYEGATVLAGTPLIQLIAEDAGPTAETEISYQGTTRLLAGDIAELEFPDGRILPVGLTLIEGAEAVGNKDFIEAEVVIPAAEAAELLPGETARLRFRRQLLPAWLGRWFDGVPSLPGNPGAEAANN